MANKYAGDLSKQCVAAFLRLDDTLAPATNAKGYRTCTSVGCVEQEEAICDGQKEREHKRRIHLAVGVLALLAKCFFACCKSLYYLERAWWSCNSISEIRQLRSKRLVYAGSQPETISLFYPLTQYRAIEGRRGTDKRKAQAGLWPAPAVPEVRYVHGEQAGQAGDMIG
jgi:hypothetical protein